MFLRNITFELSLGSLLSNYSGAFQLSYVALSWFQLIADSGFDSMKAIKYESHRWKPSNQPAIRCSKLTIETVEHGVKYVQS